MSSRRVVPGIETDSEDEAEALITGELFIPNLNFGISGKSKKKKNKAKGGRSGTSSLGTDPQPSTSRSSFQDQAAKKPYHIRRAEATAADARADKRYGKITDPRLNPDNAAYFTNTAAFNLRLREEEEQIDDSYRAKVREWRLEDLQPSKLPENINLERMMGAPLRIYRGLPVYFVDLRNFDKMMAVIRESSTNELALDIECNADFYEGNTALIQLGLRNVVFLLDPFSCYGLIKENLQPILESATVLKIMAGMANDVMYLFKDFGIRLLGVLDLQQLFMQLTEAGDNLPSVALMCRVLLENFQPPPDCTLRNWTRRPLQEDIMIEYAASDARVLLELWDALKARTNDDQRQRAAYLSKSMLLKNFSRKTHKTPQEDLKAVGVDFTQAPVEETKLFVLLHKWRQRYSKITDSYPQNLIDTRTLWKLAMVGSKCSTEEVDLVDRGIPSSVLQRQSKTLALILSEKDEKIFEKMAQCICHNCMKYGHAAKICPYPRDPKAARKWEKEHPEAGQHQKLRRRSNYKRNLAKRAQQAEEDAMKESVPVRPPSFKQASSLTDGRSRTLQDKKIDSHVTRRVIVAGHSVGALIGRNGSRIKGYQDESGARISIAREALKNLNRICIITGQRSNVDLAETLIKSFIVHDE